MHTIDKIKSSNLLHNNENIVRSNGNAIQYSEGKCCSCSEDSFVAGSDADSRANSACSLSGLDTTSSAHCLRYDPLYYHAYHIGTPSIYYAIQVSMSKCEVNDFDNRCDFFFFLILIIGVNLTL